MSSTGVGQVCEVGARWWLVTGAAGCLGTALVRRLAADGHRVRALVRDLRRAAHLAGLPGVELVAGDITDARRIEEVMNGVGGVFHLAACVHAPVDTPTDQFFAVNGEGTRNLATAAVRHGAGFFIHFSTVAVYGESEDVLDEESPVAPLTAYGRSKLAAEEVVRQTCHGTATRMTILRLPVVYGPRDRGNVARLLEAVRRGRYLIIGNGRNEKSMVAAGNVVDATLLVATDPRSAGRTYIVTDARPWSQREIAATMAILLGRPPQFFHLPYLPALALGAAADILSGLLGRPLPISVDRVRKLAQSTRYSSDRIARELGYVPRLTLAAGLREMLE